MISSTAASIIVATYNRPDALELCLLSIANQSVFPSEIVIADDGSGPETRSLIEVFSENSPIPVQHVWHQDEGFQLGKIRNKAMARATSDYLIQIDGDVVLHRHFVKDHLAAAKRGHFIGGSRVLLNEDYTERMLRRKQTHVSILKTGVRNRLNGLHLPGLASVIAKVKNERGLYNLRGCNMSFWKKDILSINGYNEAISGWGREDTELVIRLYNSGIKRVFFKLQGIVYHLYHHEYDRSSLLRNDEVLKATLDQRLIWCEKGIDQYT